MIVRVSLSLALLMAAHSAHAQANPPRIVNVRVVDERNRGVESVVRFSSGGDWRRFGATDAAGVARQPFSCSLGTVFRAEPRDLGSYFNSKEVDCSDNLRIRVVSRATPAGHAVAAEFRKFNDPQTGAQYVMVVRSSYDVKTRDLTGTGSVGAVMNAGIFGSINQRACAATVVARFDREILKVDSNGDWSPVADPAILPVPEETVIDRKRFSRSCQNAGARLKELAEDAPAKMKVYTATIVDAQVQVAASIGQTGQYAVNPPPSPAEQAPAEMEDGHLPSR
ncbi:hypothetical protein [Sphingomonas sp. KR3-1]|uniref:hypothetical protein n=1 Tax=Sphingomonas sp. KR3-1 TaxID=3156611 RepID=UPI0032B5A49A